MTHKVDALLTYDLEDCEEPAADPSGHRVRQSHSPRRRSSSGGSDRNGITASERANSRPTLSRRQGERWEAAVRRFE